MGFFSSLPGGRRNAGPPRLGLLLLSLTLPPAPLYLRGTQAGGGGARTGPGDNCQLEALLGGGKRRGRERRGRALSAPPQPPLPGSPGWGELWKEAKKEAPSPSTVSMRSRTLPPPLHVPIRESQDFVSASGPEAW